MRPTPTKSKYPKNQQMQTNSIKSHRRTHLIADESLQAIGKKFLQ